LCRFQSIYVFRWEDEGRMKSEWKLAEEQVEELAMTTVGMKATEY
jgi:hypothetical protein